MSPSHAVLRVPIFISSPSDVAVERAAALRVIEKLNDLSHIRDQYVLKPLRYEREVVPTVGDFPQMIVDRYMYVKDSYIVICLLWARMGTPFQHPKTRKHYQSGTEYEFRVAYSANLKNEGKYPHVLLYRKTLPAPDADPEQKASVDAFFRQFEPPTPRYQALYKSFGDADQFEALLLLDLDKLLSRYPPPSDWQSSIANTPHPDSLPPPAKGKSTTIHVGRNEGGIVGDHIEINGDVLLGKPGKRKPSRSDD